jgi:hypothetical protein
MPETYSGSGPTSERKALSVNIDSVPILNMTGELTKVLDPLQGTSSIANIDWDYQIYSFY